MQGYVCHPSTSCPGGCHSLHNSGRWSALGGLSMLELVHTGAGRIDEDSLAVLQSRGGNRDGVEGRGAWLGLLRSG